MNLYSTIAIAIVWIITIVCCLIMKNIQPEIFWLYVLYAAAILIAFTIFVCVPVFLG